MCRSTLTLTPILVLLCCTWFDVSGRPLTYSCLFPAKAVEVLYHPGQLVDLFVHQHFLFFAAKFKRLPSKQSSFSRLEDIV